MARKPIENFPFSDDEFSIEFDRTPDGGAFVRMDMTPRVERYLQAKADQHGLTLEQLVRVQLGFPPDPE